MKKILLPALALSAMSSAALAEPMALTDAQMDEVTAAGFAFVDAQKYILIDEDIKKNVFIEKFKDIRQRVDVRGFYADADAGANCVGFGCEAVTYAITDASAFGGKTGTGKKGTDGGFNGFPVGFATSASGAESAAPGFLDFFNGDNGAE